MDPIKLEERHSIYKEHLLKEMVQYKTMVEWAKAEHVTKQNIDNKLSRYDVKNEWREYKNSLKDYNFSKVIKNKKALVCFYFVFNKAKRFYSIFSDAEHGITNTLNSLKYNHSQRIKDNSLQEDFIKYGMENFKWKILLYCDSLRILRKCKRYFVDRDNKDCYNISTPTFSKKDHYLKLERYFIKSKIIRIQRYKYITWVWRHKLWAIRVSMNARQVHVGYHKNLIEAKKIRDNFLRKKGISIPD